MCIFITPSTTALRKKENCELWFCVWVQFYTNKSGLFILNYSLPQIIFYFMHCVICEWNFGILIWFVVLISYITSTGKCRRMQRQPPRFHRTRCSKWIRWPKRSWIVYKSRSVSYVYIVYICDASRKCKWNESINQRENENALNKHSFLDRCWLAA